MNAMPGRAQQADWLGDVRGPDHHPMILQKFVAGLIQEAASKTRDSRGVAL